MEERTGGVLALTDLTPRSDAALLLAGRIAEDLGVELDIVHAMGLRSQPLARVAPVLHDIARRIADIDDAARAQVAALHPGWSRVPAPVIDFDGPADALLQRARQARPDVSVAAAGWLWNPLGWSPDAISPTLLRALPAPLLLADEVRPLDAGRVLVFADPDSFDHAWRHEASLWHASLCRAAGGTAPSASVPDVDLIFVETGCDSAAWMRRINTTRPDLIAVPLALLDGTAEPETGRLLAQLVAGVHAPVVFLPRGAPGASTVRLYARAEPVPAGAWPAL